MTGILVLVLSPQDGARARTRCSEKAKAMRSAPLLEHEHRFAEHEHEYENCFYETSLSKQVSFHVVHPGAPVIFALLRLKPVSSR